MRRRQIEGTLRLAPAADGTAYDPTPRSATALAADRGGSPLGSMAQLRPTAHGKFLQLDEERLQVRGVTYGTFAPGQGGHRYPRLAQVDADLLAIVACGANAVRVYTSPPIWLLDLAHDLNLRVMVGLAWPQHLAFLESRRQARAIVDEVEAQASVIAGHPAVLCVAVGNEIPSQIVRWHGPRRVEAFIGRLADAVRKEDPAALVTYVNYPSTEYLELPFLDLVAFNVFLESHTRLEAYLARLQNLAGDRPLLVAELGLDARLHGSEAQARLLALETGAAFAAGCVGAFVFSWTDDWHRGDEQVTGWAFGLTDEERRPKPALRAVQDVFRNPPPTLDDGEPLVSIVVCSHNGEATIADCLSGIARLDYPRVETIVVDDGSTDSTREIALSFGARVLTVTHGGLGAARNTGLAAAMGAIVAFIDDDAAPDCDWLRFAVADLLDSNHAAIGGPNIPPEGAGLVADAVGLAPGGPTHVLLADRLAEHIPGCNMLFWRAALDAVGGFDPRFRIAGDDVDVCWRLHERGWTIGFSPAAMVWHKRRGSLRSYLHQQREYGRAEGLLERKWPSKYNSAGHVLWRGRVYEGRRPNRVERRRIHYGRWGENLFQPSQDARPRVTGLLPLMPEWYLAIMALAALTAYSAIQSGPLHRILPLPLPPADWGALLAVAVAALCLQGLRAGWFATRSRRRPRGTRLRLAGLTALLFVVQPLARLAGRMDRGLTLWRHRGPAQVRLPRPRQHELWSESWRAPTDRLLELETRLRPNCMAARRGGEYDRWDLEVRTGALGGARLRLAAEEHGSGRQLVRLRIWPLPSRTGCALMVFLLSLCWVALNRQRLMESIFLATLALLICLTVVRQCAGAIHLCLGGADAQAETPAVHRQWPRRNLHQPDLSAELDRQLHQAQPTVEAVLQE
jgi:GT2 family glycosyltransferase